MTNLFYSSKFAMYMFHRPKFNDKEPLLFGGDVDDGV